MLAMLFTAFILTTPAVATAGGANGARTVFPASGMLTDGLRAQCSAEFAAFTEVVDLASHSKRMGTSSSPRFMNLANS